jgi:hypothetical protein
VSKEKEWLKDKVVYYNDELLWNLDPDTFYQEGLYSPKSPVGWMYKEEYNKFKQDYGVEPTFAWKPIPNHLIITKEITKSYDI